MDGHHTDALVFSVLQPSVLVDCSTTEPCESNSTWCSLKCGIFTPSFTSAPTHGKHYTPLCVTGRPQPSRSELSLLWNMMWYTLLRKCEEGADYIDDIEKAIENNVCTRVTNCFSAHSSVLVFISRIAKQKHQNNTWVSAETIRHESAYIILFLTWHNEFHKWW